MSEIGNMMQRMRELAVQSANGTNSPANRLNLDAEYQELEAAIEEIIARTDFNDTNLFGPTAILTQSGSDVNETTSIKGTGVALTGALLNIDGTVTSFATANTAIGDIDAGLVILNTARADLGAAQNRLEFTSNVLAIREENAMASESAIRDADIARETTQFTRNQILVAAGVSMLSQANLVPQSALQLLG